METITQPTPCVLCGGTYISGTMYIFEAKYVCEDCKYGLHEAPEVWIEQPPRKAEPDNDDLRQYRYAPGDYTNLCQECDMDFVGDKRARTCRPCAVELYKSAKQILPK